MMSRKRAFGLSTIATLVLGAGTALYVAPGVAVSNPTQSASASDAYSDPAPQRFNATTRGCLTELRQQC